MGKLRRMPVQQRSAERFGRILDACAGLLDETGYPGLTTKEVARRAGVPIGTFYQFFAGKESLIAALAARNLDLYLERLERRFAAESPDSVAGAVDLTVDEFVAMKRSVPGFGVVDFGAGGRADVGLAGVAHVLDASVDNNTAVTERLRAAAGGLLGGEDRPDLDVAGRVALECADAVLKLAFGNDPDGDPVLITECKRVLRCYLEDRFG
ncbi:TetR/AcrR family transcriptional regulator [Streptomyces antnestii]|uniref:TetR/AcrR family transcriptional regulator n=1 Tax=Streptomyces antnestii TaxID=2494256 RepID=A0A3S2VWV9_9ACTN|nr:TetR family transcriptional regulator [Streptomyces sp. San01]RVU23258.1 TetR/AcrR family transcriptional regulator [Streptomyces sp. San01]